MGISASKYMDLSDEEELIGVSKDDEFVKEEKTTASLPEEYQTSDFYTPEFYCPVCNTTFASKGNLERHKKFSAIHENNLKLGNSQQEKIEQSTEPTEPIESAEIARQKILEFLVKIDSDSLSSHRVAGLIKSFIGNKLNNNPFYKTAEFIDDDVKWIYVDRMKPSFTLQHFKSPSINIFFDDSNKRVLTLSRIY